MIFLIVMGPAIMDHAVAQAQMPAQTAAVFKVVMSVIMLLICGVIYVAVPGGLVLFYGSRHVKATCERLDPLPRWTDKCPLPVLAQSILLWSFAACLALSAFGGFVFPFFGMLLDGIAGAAAVTVSVLLLGLAAWGVYRLRMEAWWGAVALILAWGVSATITFSRVSLMELYERMQFPEEQLEMLRESPVITMMDGAFMAVRKLAARQADGD